MSVCLAPRGGGGGAQDCRDGSGAGPTWTITAQSPLSQQKQLVRGCTKPLGSQLSGDPHTMNKCSNKMKPLILKRTSHP